MPFNSPDIETFKGDLGNNISAVLKLKADSHANIKIQSLLNITIYVSATRFLEGSVKHVIYNCCKMRGDNAGQLGMLESELKKFNNPEFVNIKAEVQRHLGFDISNGLQTAKFTPRDISFLDEIVRNRHRNVHATHDPADWYSKNIKDIINDFNKEYTGLLNILAYLDSIAFDGGTGLFRD
jgi:hypothetical protein